MRQDEKEAQGLYNEQAEAYTKACEEVIDKLELDDMMKILKDLDLLRGNILEVGAGSGQLTKLILQEGGSFEILATDQNVSLLRKLILVEDDRLRVRLTSFYTLAVCADSFDLVVSNFALNYAQDLEKVLNEISRSLHVGGHLLFSSAVANVSSQDHQKLNGTLKTSSGTSDVFAYQYTETEIREALNNAGFSVISFERFSPPYWSIDSSYAEEGIEANTFVLLARKEV